MESEVGPIIIGLGPHRCVWWQEEWKDLIGHEVSQGRKVPSRGVSIEEYDVGLVALLTLLPLDKVDTVVKKESCVMLPFLVAQTQNKQGFVDWKYSLGPEADWRDQPRI